MQTVSVVIPTFNRERVVSRAIESVYRQTEQPLEVLVIDDCSSDDTCGIVRAMSGKDPRIKLISMKANAGAGAARNLGVKAAVGDFVAFLDSDDEWLDDHLERKLGLLTQNPDVALVCGAFHVNNGGKMWLQKCKPLDGDPFEYLFLGRGGLRTSTFVVERKRMTEVMFDSSLGKHQDWDFVIALMKQHRLIVDEVPTAILHISASDRMSANLNQQASRQFYLKHEQHVSKIGKILFAAIMLRTTFMVERKSDNYYYYLDLVLRLDHGAFRFIKRIGPCLYIPWIGGRTFLSAVRQYVAFRARAGSIFHLAKANVSNDGRN